jgi:hypothetical protein
MKKSFILIPCLLIAAGCAHAPMGGDAPRYSVSSGSGSSVRTHASGTPDNPQEALYASMRKLWSDHVFWTRDYMIDALAGSPAADASSKRLQKNQEDIGKAVASFYGAQAGDQLTGLLKEHITIAVEVIAAAKADDKSKFQDENKRWQGNADQIATFLSQANPNWPKAEIGGLMNEHLKTTVEELDARLKKEFDQDVKAFDRVYDHILHMSDELSAGIIKQFPDKFGIKEVRYQ